MEQTIKRYEEIQSSIDYAKSYVIVKLYEARQREENVLNLTLDTLYFEEVIAQCLDQIKTGERIRLSLPPAITHQGKSHVDWEWLHGLKEDLSGEAIPRDVFLTIRHGGDEDPVVIVDIYHI